MSITKVVPVKPHYNTFKHLAKLFNSTKSSIIKRNIMSEILDNVESLGIARTVAALSDEDCERLEVAPIEASRFSSALLMSIQESFTVDLPLTDGKTNEANLVISINRTKLEKAFAIYASGSFRRLSMKKYLGSDIELLIPSPTEERKDYYSTTFELTFTTTDSGIVANINQVHCNTDNFLTRFIQQQQQQVLAVINQSISMN